MKENENESRCDGTCGESFSACFMDGAAVPKSRPKPPKDAPEKENTAERDKNTEKSRGEV